MLSWFRLLKHLYGTVFVVQLLSHVTAWTVVFQAPLSMGFPRQEYESGLPFPSPGALPDPGMEPTSLALAGGFSTSEPQGSPPDLLGFRQCF